MPLITDLKNTKDKSKIFEKKEYRPWSEKNNNSNLNNKKSNVDSTNSNELEKIWRCLYGAKKTLLKIIINNIEETHDSCMITGAITTNQLISDSHLPINTIKTSIHQLKLIGLISNHETKPGKGGFARYKMPKEVYEYFIEKYSSKI